MANVSNGSNLCCTTLFGRKEDELCTQVMVIEDIKNKIGSAKPGEGLSSAELECGNMKIRVKIYPNGRNEEYEGNISMAVFFKHQGKRQWKSLEVLIAENSTGSYLYSCTHMLEELLKTDKGFLNNFQIDSLLSHDMDLKNENSSFFPKGSLTVKVNIKIRGEETVTIKTTNLPDESITSSQLKGELSMHLGKMLESPRFSDVQILCQGQIIPCHRDILAARTPYFEAMFGHDMKENTTREVEIKDFDLETVKAVVHHIYTGEVKYSEESAKKMMWAADKYQLGGLKKKLEDVLIKAVKMENAIDMFVLGDAVRAYKLRDLSKEVIVKNAVAIVETDAGWKEKLGRFNNLAFEIFESVIKSKNQTN